MYFNILINNPSQSKVILHLKNPMLQLNLHLFHHQTFKVALISNPMGYVTSPTVAQLYFEFKCDANVWIHLWQVVTHGKHKLQTKYTKKIKKKIKYFYIYL